MTAGGTAGGSSAVCGNGIIQAGEQCDDGNMVTTDGCAGCQISLGYVCTGAPSMCSTTMFRINNGTTFPLISTVIDGVERIPAKDAQNQCFGFGSGTYAEFPVTPNMSHTWRAANGSVTDATTCNDVVHETWGPTTFTQPAGLYTVTIIDRSLEDYINTDFGFAYSCWEATYNDSANQTRIAKLRLNNGGSNAGTFTFRENYNIGGAITRTASGTWTETARSVTYSFAFDLDFGTTLPPWEAQWDRGGGMYVSNGIAAVPRLLYLRQTNGVGGAPINCP